MSHDLIKGSIKPDISEKSELLAARVSMGVAILIATILGLNPPGFAAQTVALAFGLAAATIFPALMMGIFVKRINSQGAIWGMVSGLLFTAVYIFLYKGWFFIPGTNSFEDTAANWAFGISPASVGSIGALLNFVVAFVVSRMTAPTPHDIQELVEFDPRAPRRRHRGRALTPMTSAAPIPGAAIPFPLGARMTPTDETLRFISSIHPYNSLPRDDLARVAGLFDRRPARAGDPVYLLGQPLEGIFLIESGAVQITDSTGDVVSLLSRGNSFGERGLMRDGLAATSARMVEDGTLLLLPKGAFAQLLVSAPAFQRFFGRGKGAGLAPSRVATTRVGDILTRKPVSCAPDTPIIDAARLMRDARVSSVGILDDGRLVGLVTVRDMSGRVVAEGLDTSAPVSRVMTAGPVTLDPDALGADVLATMLDQQVGHLPVVAAGRFVGMITQTDLMRLQAISSSVLVRDVAAAADVAAMASVTARIPELLASLVGANLRHEVVTRMITDVADAVTRRLIDLAEADLGPPPAPWCWAACGSQGRQEQTGVSDQDNCLILDDAASADDPWFAELAHRVTAGLNACGYVFCPGEMMASTPRWRQPVRVWRRYFHGWIDTPDPEAQMLASVMFDLRAIAGDGALLQALQAETLETAAKDQIFVAHMIANSLKHRPPLGLIGGFATIRWGERRNQLDLKMNGVVPVVDLGRVYALQGRLAPVNTRARLIAAQQAGVISASGGQDLIAAFDLIQTERLEHQAQQVRRGARPDNYLAPSDLPDLRRSHLRDAFVVVRTMQSAAGARGVLS